MTAALARPPLPPGRSTHRPPVCASPAWPRPRAQQHRWEGLGKPPLRFQEARLVPLSSRWTVNVYGRQCLPDRCLSRGGGGGEGQRQLQGTLTPKPHWKTAPAGAGRQRTWPAPEGRSEPPPDSAGPPAASRTEVPVPTHSHVCAWCTRVRLGLSVHARVCYVCLYKHVLYTTRPDQSEPSGCLWSG